MAAPSDEQICEWIFDNELNALFQEASCYRASALAMTKAALEKSGLSDSIAHLDHRVTVAVRQLKDLVAEFPLLGAHDGARVIEKILVFADWWQEKFGERLDIEDVRNLRNMKELLECGQKRRKEREQQAAKRKQAQEEKRLNELVEKRLKEMQRSSRPSAKQSVAEPDPDEEAVRRYFAKHPDVKLVSEGKMKSSHSEELADDEAQDD
jgi:enoyl reductase-like protein